MVSRGTRMDTGARWRKVRDSNPRMACATAGFQVGRSLVVMPAL